MMLYSEIVKWQGTSQNLALCCLTEEHNELNYYTHFNYRDNPMDPKGWDWVTELPKNFLKEIQELLDEGLIELMFEEGYYDGKMLYVTARARTAREIANEV